VTIDLVALIAVLGALLAVVQQLVALIREVRGVHTLVNSRMTELLDVTRSSSLAEGKLTGRDTDKV
jgi:hypothetical protein